MRSFRLPSGPAVAIALLLALASPVLVAQTAPAQAKDEPPLKLIERLSREVLAILADKNAGVQNKRRKIQDIAYAHIDFPVLSRLTLGRNWRDLSEAQRADFMKEYRVHLANTYRSMIDNYTDEEVRMVGEREEDRGDRTVLTKVVDPKNGEEFKVDYRLRHEDAGWRIIDITIEGVSLAANFRAQFQDVISKGGFEQLMKLLREKNAAAEKETGSGKKE